MCTRFPPSFVESNNSFVECNAHGGESNGLLGLHVESKSLDVNYGTKGCFEYGFIPHGESEKHVTADSAYYKDPNEREVQRQFEEGILDIFIHHAMGIHNICIYDNQDVFAKFCLSHNPEEALCTKVVKRGGKNPVFNQSLQIAIGHLDSVLKCEIWMSSIARSYLEDQLLGFVLVPLSSIVGKGKLSGEYGLSSTDLFHSHAGTIKLTLMYHERRRSSSGSQLLNGKLLSSDALGAYPLLEGTDDSSTPSGISALSSACGEIEKLSVCDYDSVEFPDMQAIDEDQQLVSKYLSAASNKGDCSGDAGATQNGMITGPPFLQLGSVTVDQAACHGINGEKQCGDISSMTDDCQLFSFSGTPVSEVEKNFNVVSDVSEGQSSARSQMNGSSSATYPASSGSQTGSGNSSCQDFDAAFSAPSASFRTESSTRERGGEKDILGRNFTVPLVNVSIETEPKVVQQEIVDMYMKSMQQFTEALAKMQLPMDVDSQEAPPANNSSSEHDSGESSKKNSHRVFYGSRAFF
ncbi:hypothetical protein O6H91_04G032900 [Diphasiastrum complanatum]|uniref:Uncharacterized protein n=1 Tax=Diphasiastrum complanatum TaxID=34168 RepID=A0ACC2DWC5_DIPCM|nr:hypothetical protein O6H91_04G032900 [Diphasiastrum complanatum]